jgi:hypothetical protein
MFVDKHGSLLVIERCDRVIPLQNVSKPKVLEIKISHNLHLELDLVGMTHAKLYLSVVWVQLQVFSVKMFSGMLFIPDYLSLFTLWVGCD